MIILPLISHLDIVNDYSFTKPNTPFNDHFHWKILTISIGKKFFWELRFRMLLRQISYPIWSKSMETRTFSLFPTNFQPMKISTYFPVIQVNPNKKQEATQRLSLEKERGQSGGGGRGGGRVGQLHRSTLLSFFMHTRIGPKSSVAKKRV